MTKPDLESDLKACDWIRHKCRSDRVYAQNLYAAMCNQNFQKQQIWPILLDQIWHCSWRYAGGIVADLRGEGDYLDWYCSGMMTSHPDDDLDIGYHKNNKGFVAESEVTDEIRQDLATLGWHVLQESS